MKPTIEELFLAFHSANPNVYAALCRLARQAVAKGRKRVGMKMLFEVVRWEVFLTTQKDEFKLNNNYTARYARLIMEQEPDLAGVFETRELQRT